MFHLSEQFLNIDEKSIGSSKCFSLLLSIISFFVLQPLGIASIGYFIHSIVAPTSMSLRFSFKAEVENILTRQDNKLDMNKFIIKILEASKVAAQSSRSEKPKKGRRHSVSLIYLFTPQEKKVNEDNCNAVKHALRLFISCLLSREELLEQFYKYQDLKDWLLAMLLKTPERTIREETSNALHSLCIKVSENKEFSKVNFPFFFLYS